MPGEVIDRPNPQPVASHIPDDVLALAVKLNNAKLSDADLKGLEEFRRASNYIAAGKKSLSIPNRVDRSFSLYGLLSDQVLC
jgi:xylulose-5-phosphate/fructose-6-phosphate phosphoketolase